MAYRHLSRGARENIYRWLKEGKSKGKIGKLLDRPTSTITRELKRNTGKRGYRSKQAQRKATARARRGGYRTFTKEMRTEVEGRIRDGQTPEMIQGRVRLEGRPMACKERIYQYVYAEAKGGGTLWKNLPRAKRKRHRRCPRQDGRGRGRIPDQRMIDTRPAAVETRERVGDWEGDLINGDHGTGHLVTLAERKTIFTLCGRIGSKDAQETRDMIKKLFDSIPLEFKKTVTFDNGKEFSDHKGIAEQNSIDVYFAHPYHSWERGTNENTNGLIRRIYPKGSSFEDIGEKELAKIDRNLNDRPRKRLGWLTSREALYREFALHGYLMFNA